MDGHIPRQSEDKDSFKKNPGGDLGNGKAVGDTGFNKRGGGEFVEIVEEEYLNAPGNPSYGIPNASYPGRPPFPPPHPGQMPPLSARPFPPPPFIPPYGRPIPPPVVSPPFMPPPPSFMPPPAPAGRIEYEYVEEYSQDIPGNDYYEEPLASPADESAPTPLSLSSNFTAPSTRSIRSMRSKAIDRIQAAGEITAKKNKESYFKRYMRACIKIAFTLTVLAILATICLFAIFSFRERLNNKSEVEENNASISSFSGSDYVWRMENTAGAAPVKAFYDKLGSASAITEDKDFLIRGTIEMNSKTRDFYAIRKLDDKTFLKIGDDSDTSTYIIGSLHGGVFRLLSGGLMGEKANLKEKEALILKAIVSFDNLLFTRVFSSRTSKNVFVNDSHVEYGGKVSFNGEECDSLSLMDGDCRIQYFFNLKTRLLEGCEYNWKNMNVRTVFSNYRKFEPEYSYPTLNTVYMNGSVVAKIKIDLITRRPEIFFPR